MSKNIWIALFWVIGLMVLAPSASADGGKGVKTTLSRQEPVQEMSTIVLATPSEQAPPPPTRRKCRWVKTGEETISVTLSASLMPTALAGCGNSVVQVGGGVFSTPLPESTVSSSRRVCD